jgi:hypothetical protein
MIEWFKVLVLKTKVFNKIPWVQIPLYPYKIKVKNGFEPLLKDLQSFTLPLCYLTFN